MSDIEFTAINALIQVIAYVPFWLPIAVATWAVIWAVTTRRNTRTEEAR